MLGEGGFRIGRFRGEVGMRGRIRFRNVKLVVDHLRKNISDDIRNLLAKFSSLMV